MREDLYKINKRNGMDAGTPCLFDDGKMEQLIGVIRTDVGGKLEVLATEMKHVSSQQRDMLRWLLVVVCVIALGKGAIDVIEKVWARPAIIKEAQ